MIMAIISCKKLLKKKQYMNQGTIYTAVLELITLI